MTSNQMELEFHRFQKQTTFQCSKERLKQIQYVSDKKQQNTLSNKTGVFASKNQKIKFRFPIMDDLSLDPRSIQLETVETCNQTQFIQKNNLQTQVRTRKSIEMEEENKENINQILIEQPFYDVNKLLPSQQVDIFNLYNEQVQNKMHEQQF